MRRKGGQHRTAAASHTSSASEAKETFGARLRRYRKRMQYSLTALANDAETDALTLRRFEWDGGADIVPDVRLGLRLAHVLGVHPYRLAFGTDGPLASEVPRVHAWLEVYEARADAEDAGAALGGDVYGARQALERR
jgi:transcriptional regulator with XRE-family HTH domain